MGANYHSACRARSRAEFIAMLAYWLEIIIENGMLTALKISSYYEKPTN